MKLAESCPLDQIRKALNIARRHYDKPILMIGVSNGFHAAVSNAMQRQFAGIPLKPDGPVKLFGYPLVIDDTLPRCSFAIRMRPTL